MSGINEKVNSKSQPKEDELPAGSPRQWVANQYSQCQLIPAPLISSSHGEATSSSAIVQLRLILFDWQRLVLLVALLATVSCASASTSEVNQIIAMRSTLCEQCGMGSLGHFRARCCHSADGTSSMILEQSLAVTPV